MMMTRGAHTPPFTLFHLTYCVGEFESGRVGGDTGGNNTGCCCCGTIG
jgi:hypothetical protein